MRGSAECSVQTARRKGGTGLRLLPQRDAGRVGHHPAPHRPLPNLRTPVQRTSTRSGLAMLEAPTLLSHAEQALVGVRDYASLRSDTGLDKPAVTVRQCARGRAILVSKHLERARGRRFPCGGIVSDRLHEGSELLRGNSWGGQRIARFRTSPVPGWTPAAV